jgi:hypothetical protein
MIAWLHALYDSAIDSTIAWLRSTRVTWTVKDMFLTMKLPRSVSSVSDTEGNLWIRKC